MLEFDYWDNDGECVGEVLCVGKFWFGLFGFEGVCLWLDFLYENNKNNNLLFVWNNLDFII